MAAKPHNHPPIMAPKRISALDQSQDALETIDNLIRELQLYTHNINHLLYAIKEHQ